MLELWRASHGSKLSQGLQHPDSSRAEVRKGVNAVNLALTVAGEISSEELVEDFG